MHLSRSCASLRLFAAISVSALSLLALAAPARAQTAPRTSWKFDFGPATSACADGYISVTPETTYTPERGFGFEPDTVVSALDRHTTDPLTTDFITSEHAFYFSADVPEGNYHVTVTLGDVAGESTTTVKAELRRLMLEKVATVSRTVSKHTFTVNVRRPQITATNGIAAGEVKLKAPRETTQEAWAWDGRLTLEFNGARPAVCAIEISAATVPTLFLIGDSTETDQSREPYNSWGQMLPRWFRPDLAVANHGESGETYRDSIGRRRLDKILSVMKSGDTLLMQFGTNDQKQIAAKTGGPFTTYKAEIKTHVDAVRARGGIPVIVSPVERRGFNEQGHVIPSLADYVEASGQAAQELGVVFIDLNAMSTAFYEALGPEGSKVAFAQPEPGKVDNTHHNSYGSYELAKCIVVGIQRAGLKVAQHVVDDFPGFDPAHPDAPESFAVPPSPLVTNQRPLGEANVH